MMFRMMLQTSACHQGGIETALHVMTAVHDGEEMKQLPGAILLVDASNTFNVLTRTIVIDKMPCIIFAHRSLNTLRAPIVESAV